MKAIRYYKNSMFNNAVITFFGVTIGRVKEQPEYAGNSIFVNGFKFPQFSQN